MRSEDYNASTAEQDQTTQADQASDAKQKQQNARRRLLKAATVAPVIYTLPNGTALAATSSTCREDSVVSVSKETETDVDGNQIETGNLVSSDGRIFEPSNSGDPNDPTVYYNSTKKYVSEGESTLVAESCWSSVNAQTASSTNHFQRIV
ncbi:MAG: hypothetical protein VBE63_23965 [Lamprobacter sp.]|uniref:hypothetical protein n=1 Tax=Lamprobacter sp. TaxID=3100796 RepID=UPI002B25EB0F|nr:hypothetical protein [Lamprobacter sp.]MEA3642972.1 hypothetical protein [Lamprobacter sp.]